MPLWWLKVPMTFSPPKRRQPTHPQPHPHPRHCPRSLSLASQPGRHYHLPALKSSEFPLREPSRGQQGSPRTPVGFLCHPQLTVCWSQARMTPSHQPQPWCLLKAGLEAPPSMTNSASALVPYVIARSIYCAGLEMKPRGPRGAEISPRPPGILQGKAGDPAEPGPPGLAAGERQGGDTRQVLRVGPVRSGCLVSRCCKN